MTTRRGLLAGTAAMVAPISTSAEILPSVGMYPDPHPDAELLGWCAALIEMEAEYRSTLTGRDDDPGYHEGYNETLQAVINTPAKTAEGNRAKLAAAVSFYEPDPPDEGSLFDKVLWDAVTNLALPPVTAPVVAVSPDADIIRLCAEHIDNLRAYNDSDIDLPDGDPLQVAYERTLEALCDAEPQTMAGMVAKARAAKVEAIGQDGEEVEFYNMGHNWAMDLVNDLLRLHGRTST